MRALLLGLLLAAPAAARPIEFTTDTAYATLVYSPDQSAWAPAEPTRIDHLHWRLRAPEAEVPVWVQGETYAGGLGWFQPFRIHQQVTKSTAMHSLASTHDLDYARCSIPILAVLALGYALRARRQVSRVEEREQTAKLEIARVVEASQLYRSDGRHPERVGHYQVVSFLGQGGMAYVYRVRGPDGQEGALKLPLQQLVTDREFRDRFAREMRLCSRLHHPGVVRIDFVNYASSMDEVPFFVMEVVEGRSLDQTPRPMPLGQALSYARKVLTILDYIHGQEVVHRDIKPANVMELGNGELKVMDFGLALLSQEDRTRLTASGQILGTPAFMAPEQIHGQEATPASDLYAVGLMVYEFLAGKLPFPDDFMAVLSMKAVAQVPPLRTVLPDLPAAVLAWVERMTADQPQDRFPSASAALQALPE